MLGGGSEASQCRQRWQETREQFLHSSAGTFSTTVARAKPRTKIPRLRNDMTVNPGQVFPLYVLFRGDGLRCARICVGQDPGPEDVHARCRLRLAKSVSVLGSGFKRRNTDAQLGSALFFKGNGRWPNVMTGTAAGLTTRLFDCSTSAEGTL